MSEIKEVIETLAKVWSWAAVKAHPTRRQIITKRADNGLYVRIQNPGKDLPHTFTIRHQKKDGDLRLWTKTPYGLVQWRSCPKKGDRLVYQPFGSGGRLKADRVAIEDIFIDPLNVDEGEVEMFKVLYPEIAPLLPLFLSATDEIDMVLQQEDCK